MPGGAAKSSVLALCVLAVSCAPRHGGSGLNVVVVLVDTLRQDHVHAYGYPRETTPTLDRLVNEGAAFDAVSPTSWTKAAVASLFTGFHPVRHQAVAYADRLSDQASTMAEALRENGWSTSAVSANSWIDPGYGFGQGFATFVRTRSAHLVDPDASAVNRLVAGVLPRLREPFFLYVHYIDPHAPYTPRAAWNGGSLASDRRRAVSVGELAMASIEERSPELMRDAVDLYDGEIRQVDQGIGELLGLLEKRGLGPRTLLVVTSDHGEEFEEHGRTGHGQTVYDEVVRVPLIFHGPGVKGGRRAGVASLMDVYPTILELTGVSRGGTPTVDGLSLAASLLRSDPLPASRPLLLHLDFSMGHQVGLLDGCWELVLGGSPMKKQLFDVCRDRRRDVWAETLPATGQRLAGELAELFNASAHPALAAERAGGVADLAEILQGLGYIGAARLDRKVIFPRRLRPADTSPTGLFGWENLSDLKSCVEPGSPSPATQLTAGWYDAEVGGRWTNGSAGVVVRAAPGGAAAQLEIAGTSFRPDSFELSVFVDERPAASAQIQPGSFSIVAPLDPARDREYRLVELRSSTLYTPSEHGAGDRRSLGAFVSSICTRAAPQPTGVASRVP